MTGGHSIAPLTEELLTFDRYWRAGRQLSLISVLWEDDHTSGQASLPSSWPTQTGLDFWWKRKKTQS